MTNYNEYTENTLPVLTEHDAYERFDAMLDDCYGDVEVAGYTYRASYALRELGPTTYRCEFLDYVDSMREEFIIEGY